MKPKKDCPRYIVTREFNGEQSLQAAFEQVFETMALRKFERRKNENED